MFDFSDVRRDDLKIAFGATIGIGIGSFITSGGGLAGRVRFAAAMAAVAALTVALFLTLD